MNLKGVLEGILFVVGDDGITLKELRDIMNIEDNVLKELILELKKEYEDSSRGIRLSILGDAFKLTTKKEHKEYYQKLLTNEDSNNLSTAALETLAIVAYNEPITRVEIDEIRGVATSNVVRKLVAKGLIKECGKSTLPGRPILYKTTNDFLDYFNIEKLSDLPNIEMISETIDEIDLYESKYVDENI